MSRELLEVVAVCESHAAPDSWLGPFTCVMDIFGDNLAPCLGFSESHPGDLISFLVSDTALALSVEHEHQSNAGSTKVVSKSSAHVHCVPGVSIVGGMVVSRAILMYLPLVRPLPTPACPDPPLGTSMLPFYAEMDSPLWEHLKALGLMYNQEVFSAMAAAAERDAFAAEREASAAKAAACERVYTYQTYRIGTARFITSAGRFFSTMFSTRMSTDDASAVSTDRTAEQDAVDALERVRRVEVPASSLSKVAQAWKKHKWVRSPPPPLPPPSPPPQNAVAALTAAAAAALAATPVAATIASAFAATLSTTVASPVATPVAAAIPTAVSTAIPTTITNAFTASAIASAIAASTFRLHHHLNRAARESALSHGALAHAAPAAALAAATDATAASAPAATVDVDPPTVAVAAFAVTATTIVAAA
eukprot:jgi/Chrpa1/15215/Chrysochromulina_OHIO_Genome00015860-RA